MSFELKREFQLYIAALLAFQLATSLAAVGLLGRMSPVIGEIMDENVVSIEAAEEMLTCLALREAELEGVACSDSFYAALRRAKYNITEAEETPIIAQLERVGPSALQGDSNSVRLTVGGLQELTRINRQAMHTLDEEAQRLGTAGAWAIVMLALAGFTVSFVVVSSMRRRIVDPLAELYDVLRAVEAGDEYPRCLTRGSPREIVQIQQSVNRLLDRKSEPPKEESADDTDRVVVNFLLDKETEPMFVVDKQGEVRMSNSAGLALLSTAAGKRIRNRLRRVRTAAQPVEGLRVARISHELLWVCVATTKQNGHPSQNTETRSRQEET